MTSSTETIVSALRYLAGDGIYSQDGVANAAIAEAADRLEDINFQNKCFENQHKIFNMTLGDNRQAIDRLRAEVEEAEAYADKLVQHKDMACLPKDLENLREANEQFVEEIKDLEEECTHLAQYVRLLQEENEKFESKLREQSDNNGMKKFAISMDRLKDEVLFELIIQGSKVATEYDYKTFYTNTEGVPHDWYNTFIDDLRSATTYRYKGERFNVLYSSCAPSDEYDNGIEQDDLVDDTVAYIFYHDKVYAFDAYFTDCEIFQRVINNR